VFQKCQTVFHDLTCKCLLFTRFHAERIFVTFCAHLFPAIFTQEIYVTCHFFPVSSRDETEMKFHKVVFDVC
jgi:hypothetical protein